MSISKGLGIRGKGEAFFVKYFYYLVQNNMLHPNFYIKIRVISIIRVLSLTHNHRLDLIFNFKLSSIFLTNVDFVPLNTYISSQYSIPKQTIVGVMQF